MRCNICKSELKDILYLKNGVQIEKCKKCGLVYQNPLITKLDDVSVKDYYDDININNKLLFHNMKLDAKERLHSLLKIHSKGSLFDVGCGFGHFINETLEFFDSKGLELSKKASDYARKLCKVEIFNDDFDSFVMKNSYDIVTMYHILEHLRDPSSAIQKISKSLNPNGLIVIEIPNFNSIFSFIQKEKWWYIQPYNHLYYFTKSTLTCLLEKFGLRIIHVEYTGGLGFADTYVEKNPGKELPGLFKNPLIMKFKDLVKFAVNYLKLSNVIRIYARKL